MLSRSMKLEDIACVPQSSFNCSQSETPVSVPGDDAQRCLAVVAKPHFPVESVRGRVVAHDVKKGSFAALHLTADQF
jgi:hypothetical protein